MLDSIQNESGVNLNITSPGQFVSDNLKYVYGAAGIVLLFMLISAGYQMIFSRGDPKAMQVAQSKITTSIIGIVILFASFWIVEIILDFFGIGLDIIG